MKKHHRVLKSLTGHILLKLCISLMIYKGINWCVWGKIFSVKFGKFQLWWQGADTDVTDMIGITRIAFIMSRTSGHLAIKRNKPKEPRTKLYSVDSNIKAMLLHGCETWRTTKMMQQTIQTFFNTCFLRCIFNVWCQRRSRMNISYRASRTGKSGLTDLAEEKGLNQASHPSPDLEPTK